MDGKSLNLTHELLQQLQQLVPQAFSEGKLDTVALKRLLGEDVFVQGERYGLNWRAKPKPTKCCNSKPPPRCGPSRNSQWIGTMPNTS